MVRRVLRTLKSDCESLSLPLQLGQRFAFPPLHATGMLVSRLDDENRVTYISIARLKAKDVGRHLA